MTDKIKIFGYGSLLLDSSLRRTVKNPMNATPAFVKGYIRNFSFDGVNGYTYEGVPEDVFGIPFNGANMINAQPDEMVNGVVFEVDEQDFAELKIRETNYHLVKTNYYDFKNQKLLGECSTFISEFVRNKFEYNVAQKYYVDICLEGARSFGIDFFEEFLKTTYINENRIDKVPALQVDIDKIRG